MNPKPQYFFAFITITTLLLGSCSPAPAINTPIPPTSTTTFTLTPTEIPSTPTETPDPDAPDAYTRLESGIYYLDKKTEKGNTLTYTWDKVRKVYERQLFYGPIIPASLEQKPYGSVGDLMMTVTIDNTIAGEAQLQTISPHQKWEPFASPNWANLFRVLLSKQMANAGIIPNSRTVNWRPFVDGSHAYHFDFKTAEGQQSEGIWQGATTTVRILGNFNQLAEDSSNGFSKVSSLGIVGEPASDYMVKIWTKDGNTYIDIAPSLPASKWTPKDIMWMFMYGPSVIMDCSGSVSNGQECDLSKLPDISLTLGDFIANMKQSPLFDLTPPQ